MKYHNYKSFFIVLGGLALVVVGISLFSSRTFTLGGVLVPACNGTFTNSSTTVNTTATLVLAESSYGCGAVLRNDSGAPQYCWLTSGTAASSSMQLNSGYKLNSTTSTDNGAQELRLGTEFGGLPYQKSVICISSAAGRMLILKK